MRRSEFHSALASATWVLVVSGAVSGVVSGVAPAWAGTPDSPAGEQIPASRPAAPKKLTNAAKLAAEPTDPQAGLPEEGQYLRIDEKIGQTLAVDIPLVDNRGTSVTMADYLGDDGLPVVLTFNYSSCPMLCNSQLNGLVDAMEKGNLVPGQHYRVITVAIDHRESTEQIANTKARYVGSFREDMRASVDRGWTFVRGTESDVRALADSVGFPFRYLEDQNQFAHPASLIFLSPAGVITRYYHGIYYEPDVFDRSIFQAGAGEHGVSVGFLLACLTPSHQEGHAEAGVAAMRYGALGFVLLLFAAFGTWQMLRTRSARQEQIG